MTPEQRRVLGPRIKAMVRHNKHVWWELKRQCFESGSSGAGVYHWESIYRDLAPRFIGALSDEDKSVLVTEWKRKSTDANLLSDETILTTYDAIVAEEIVRRAEIASNRTISW
jgi:hypothetical protein